MNWFSDILHPLLHDRLPDNPDAPVVVFSADTDRTQAYVFESNKLPEIRGASRQLSALNDSEAIRVFFEEHGWNRDALLYAGGGSVLALLPDENNARALADWLAAEYAKETRVVTISCVWQAFRARQILEGFAAQPPLSAKDSFHNLLLQGFWQPDNNGKAKTRQHFGTVMLDMGIRLRRAKTSRAGVPYIETMPMVELCSSCESRPANKVRSIGGDGVALCSVCDRKRIEGQGKQRHHWIEELRDQLVATYPAFPEPDRVVYPQDVDELIGAKATEERSGAKDVALIYTDGDSIGQHIKERQTPSEFVALSTALHSNTRTAVAQALGRVIAPYDFEEKPRFDSQGRHILSWEVITIGGDDVLMLVPAWAALKVAYEIAGTFYELSQQSLSMSVGFAVGKASAPIRVLYEAARSALKNAKRRSYQEQQPCIDYHNFVREGYPSASLSLQRKKNLSHNGKGRMLLYGRPYTLTEVAALLRSVELLREAKFPRSQLHALTEELRFSEVRGSLFYDYQLTRLKPALRDSLIELEVLWHSQEYPWIVRGDTRLTVLPDLLDLL